MSPGDIFTCYFFRGGRDTGRIHNQPFYEGLILQTSHSARAWGAQRGARAACATPRIKGASQGRALCCHVPKSLWAEEEEVAAVAAQAQADKEQQSPLSQRRACFRGNNKCDAQVWKDAGVMRNYRQNWTPGRGPAAAPSTLAAETRFPGWAIYLFLKTKGTKQVLSTRASHETWMKPSIAVFPPVRAGAWQDEARAVLQLHQAHPLPRSPALTPKHHPE